MIDDVDQKIDEIERNNDRFSENAQVTIDRRLTDLKDAKLELQQELDSVGDKTEENWDDFETGVGQNFDELKTDLKQISDDIKEAFVTMDKY